jgi:hypothetical protein
MGKAGDRIYLCLIGTDCLPAWGLKFSSSKKEEYS